MSSDGGEPEIDEEQQKEEATKIAESLANPETVTKYKAAAEIANSAFLAAACSNPTAARQSGARAALRKALSPLSLCCSACALHNSALPRALCCAQQPPSKAGADTSAAAAEQRRSPSSPPSSSRA